MINPRIHCHSLITTGLGSFIYNHHDTGVATHLRQYGVYEADELQDGELILSKRRDAYGDGVVAIDCGANIGLFAVPWSRHMHGWGRLIAFEAQERLFYALAGNIALNDCFNAKGVHAAVSNTIGTMAIPVIKYDAPTSFGSIALKASTPSDGFAKEVDYSHTETVPTVTLDSYDLERLDFLKIDVEGMELEILEGATETIQRCKPVIVAEWMRSDENALRGLLEDFGYTITKVMPNFIATHADDEIGPWLLSRMRSRRLEVKLTQAMALLQMHGPLGLKMGVQAMQAIIAEEQDAEPASLALVQRTLDTIYQQLNQQYGAEAVKNLLG